MRQRAIITDSSAVIYILSGARAGNSKLGRLSLNIQTLPFKIILKHRSGQDNVLPDSLSRFFHNTRPHLRLNNVNEVDREQIHMPTFEDGDVVTLEQLNVFVNQNEDCIFPFLANKNDIKKVEEFELIQEMHDIPTDIEQTLALDNSLEGQAFAQLMEPLIKQPLDSIETISMASKEVTWENIIKAQREDAACLKQIRQVERGHDVANLYRIEHGMLVRKRYPEKQWNHPGNSLAVIPSTNSEMVTNIIATLHYGHHGYKKMLVTIRRLFYISGIKKLVLEFVRGCHICSILRLRTMKRDENDHLFIPDHPMQIIDIDFIYMTKIRGYQYILSMIDRYSKKAFAVACTSMKSSAVIKALDNLFMNHGIPEMVTGDNQASLLRSTEVMNYCRSVNCRIKTSIPFNSRSNALVESQNGALRYTLKALCFQHDTTDWVRLLGLCVYLMNTSPNTGLPQPLTPDMVHFGRDIVKFPFQAHKVSGHVLPEEYVTEKLTVHQANHKAIAAYNKWRFKYSPRDSQNRQGTYNPFSPGKYCYFRRLNLGVKPGTGPKYVNTLYKIEKVYYSLITLRDVFKVTAPPYTITTTMYFLKPFSERPPHLFKHVQPDQEKIGGPLLAKDLPDGNEDIIKIPAVYDPNPPPKPKPITTKPVLQDDSSEDEPSAREDTDSESDNENPVRSTPLVTPQRGDTKIDTGTSKPVSQTNILPDHPPPPPKPEKNLTAWLKQAIALPGRRTRSGQKL